MVKTSPSNAGSMASVADRGGKIPLASPPKSQNIKKKERERNNILTNSIKTLKMVHREKQKDSMRQHFKYFLGLDKGSCSSTLDFFLKIY